MKIETERLELEPLNESHYLDYYALDQDAEVMKYVRKPLTSDEEGRFFFDRSQRYQKAHPGLGYFAILERGSREFMGIGVLVHIELNPLINEDRVEVGYRLHQKYWGKGYATEVAKALIQYGFKTLGLKEIYGTTSPENIRSQKTLIKAGLKYIGEIPYYGGSKVYRI